MKPAIQQTCYATSDSKQAVLPGLDGHAERRKEGRKEGRAFERPGGPPSTPQHTRYPRVRASYGASILGETKAETHRRLHSTTDIRVNFAVCSLGDLV